MNLASAEIPASSPVRAQSGACVACPNGTFHHVEDHFDRTGKTTYRLFSCAGCGVVFSEPRKAVGADWYEKAVSSELPVAPEKDRRFKMFFEDRLPGGKLLDIGCGEGAFLRLAQKHGYAFCAGFDYDPRKTSDARAKGISASTQSWESFCRDHQESEFDIITLFDVLEHTPEPAAFIDAVRRMLKPGGHVVITLPNARRPLPFGREEWDFPPHHFTRWYPETLRLFLERKGFAVVRQSASDLELRYFLDVMVAHGVMKPLLRLARALLFGKGGSEAASVTELYAQASAAGSHRKPGTILADKRLRAAMFASFKVLAQAALWPVAGLMVMSYRARRGDAGNHLYTLARKKDVS